MPKDSSAKKRSKKLQGGRFAEVTPGGEVKERWGIMFDRLVEFKGRHGHCLVPNRYKEDRSLGAWVSTHRRQYNVLTSGSSQSTPMTPERASRLVSIGFVWATKDPRQVPWETRYKQLIEFKKKSGHCVVPVGYNENRRLANWVSTQRHEKKLLKQGRPSKLTEERVYLLDEIGFVWEAQRGGTRHKKPTETDSTAVAAAQGPNVSRSQFRPLAGVRGSSSHAASKSVSLPFVGPGLMMPPAHHSRAELAMKTLTPDVSGAVLRSDRIRADRALLLDAIERDRAMLHRIQCLSQPSYFTGCLQGSSSRAFGVGAQSLTNPQLAALQLESHPQLRSTGFHIDPVTASQLMLHFSPP